MREAFTAWAVDSRSKEGHGLLGRYFFSHCIPPSAEGCLIALFPTRRQARQAIKDVFKDYTPSDWEPRAVKVEVMIDEAKGAIK